MTNEAKRMSAEALELLKSAVLIVIDENTDRDCIGPAEISRRAGIYRERGPNNKMNDAITTGVINSLENDRLIEKCRPGVRGSGYRRAR